MAKIPKCGRLSRPALWSTLGRTLKLLDFTFTHGVPRAQPFVKVGPRAHTVSYGVGAAAKLATDKWE